MGKTQAANGLVNMSKISDMINNERDALEKYRGNNLKVEWRQNRGEDYMPGAGKIDWKGKPVVSMKEVGHCWCSIIFTKH